MAMRPKLFVFVRLDEFSKAVTTQGRRVVRTRMEFWNGPALTKQAMSPLRQRDKNEAEKKKRGRRTRTE